MTEDVYDFVLGVFSTLFSIFSSWHIPGTNLSPAMWFVFLLSAGVLFRFLKKLGFGSASFDDVNNAAKFDKKD